MRTDDFDGPKSEDADDRRPDVLAADSARDQGEGDGFNEFDAPLPGQKSNSLGDLWRDNPIVKLGTVAVVVVGLIAAFLIFGGSKSETVSRVGTAVDEREAPGQQTSEAYRDAINEVNQQRLDQAVATGESTMPIPTATDANTSVDTGTGEPPVTIDDPLAGWRSGNQDVGPDPTLDPNSAPMLQNPQQAGPAVPTGPDPAAVDAMAQAMSQQMGNILGNHAVRGSQILTVTSSDYLNARSEAAAQAVAAVPDVEIQEIIIPAGTIVYAQTLTESNTDAPGPVLARLSSGPLAGSRVLGSFDEAYNYLVLNFNTVVVNGISQPVQAVALDPKTTLPAVVTDIDHRYWRRVIFPAAARFIEGMGNAVAQREQTIVTNGDTTISSRPDLNTRQEAAAGFAEGVSELADELDEEGDRTRIMVKVRAGTPIGILFLEPVIKNPT